MRAVYVRRARAADSLQIPAYRELGAAECGRRYQEFLRKHGLRAPQTVVSLPRAAVLLRRLEFPKTVEKELARAVEYQLDSLHPFEEGSVYWDCAVWKGHEASAWQKLTANPSEADGGRLETLLAIAQRKGVDETAAWFQEAGIPVSQFGVKAALCIEMFWPRLQAAFPQTPALLTLEAAADRAEIIGYSPGCGLFWLDRSAADADSPAAFAQGVQGALEFARAELQIPPEQRAPLIVCGNGEAAATWLAGAELPFQVVPAEQLAGPTAEGKGLDPEQGWTALAAAHGGDVVPLNLLPAEKRTYEPPGTHLATYILAALVAALALALGARGPAQDWLYSQRLEREMQALRPQLQELQATQTSAEQAQQRLRVLSGARQSARVPLEILNELTRILPRDAWLQQFTYDGATVSVSGTAPAASGLLQTLAESPYFENPQFRTSITRSAEGQESFAITARLRAGTVEGTPQ